MNPKSSLKSVFIPLYFVYFCCYGGLAQLARAPRWQRGGHRFESDILHIFKPNYLICK